MQKWWSLLFGGVLLAEFALFAISPAVVQPLRDPNGRPAARVEVDGRTWGRFDGPRELVFLGPESGVRKIRVHY